ncbi:MAG: DUF1552 domain-containing protein [Myxococcales bacterium]|nr:DUF1552 domain-containing protein [Myxococcales bacterium]
MLYRPRRPIPRRSFLRGVAAGGAKIAIGLPLLDTMLNNNATALAQNEPLPVRYGVFYWGGGVNHKTWVPSETGTNWTLPESLEPFDALKPYVTLVTGYDHVDSSPGHIPSRGIALSSSHDMTQCKGDCVGTYRGQNMPEPSVDVIVSEAWAGRTTFDWLGVGICRRGPYKSNTSWKAGGRAYNRHEPSPQALFDRLFSGEAVTGDPGGGDGSMLAATSALETSMLDGVLDQARALSPRLGATDRQRLEQHMEGLRSLERRLQARATLPVVDCQAPDPPAQTNFGDGGTHEEKEAKATIMSDLLSIALACDLSRVFSYEFSAGQSGAVYWEVGLNGEHHDDVTHGKSQTQDHTNVIRFIMQNYAYFAQRLASMPEGDGNVLDRTLIFGTSEHGDAGKHIYVDHPFLLLGLAGGALKGGLHHRRSGGMRTDAPRMLLTGVRAVGVSLDKLGQENSTGPRVATEVVSEILT